ncbi:MAG: RpiB/LacA/LacB family sugar-phosphate isomerase [Thermoguttaceae bacterium]|nr:RpiB/LacA/LacB family sugar-phosphate isomerase [Thermoguttaceae bacterium]MBQ3333339.1 RpiB/LacA/LacB family sugar-phosphate isomerase [Thermoguttaceae bacterium]MBQ6618517.1 RpiB/LacA/LacB family sugar-phosphate isomerase [Thermoguttaceae bacterium]
MKIVVAADPFAISLKNALVPYLTDELGHTVIDVGSSESKEVPYFEAGSNACRVLQSGEAERAILLCGTGMGMSIVANHFPGVRASVVESVFAARMCRAINDANALCLGAMIWGEWMAKEAVDVFLKTNIGDGLESLAEGLKAGVKAVEAIRPAAN